jgi:hypothetical protein
LCIRACAFNTFALTWTLLTTADLAAVTGCKGPAAIAGAANTNTASSAAEIVLIMIISCSITKLTGRMAGLVDHGSKLRRRG